MLFFFQFCSWAKTILLACIASVIVGCHIELQKGREVNWDELELRGRGIKREKRKHLPQNTVSEWNTSVLVSWTVRRFSNVMNENIEMCFCKPPQSMIYEPHPAEMNEHKVRQFSTAKTDSYYCRCCLSLFLKPKKIYGLTIDWQVYFPLSYPSLFSSFA